MGFRRYLPYFYSEVPDHKRRSIFTWGHPINDYRNYIENMARLKLNQLIIWNDFVPINAKEIIDYAGVPFIIKGVMTVKGALKALEAGASAIVVSNHGGRVLDQCPATAEVLPAIVDAVGGKMTILVDGGIRTGIDVFKALALGADAVIMARPYVTALYGGGAEGVQILVEKLKAKGTQSVRSRIGNIRDFLKEDMDLPAFWEYLKTALAGDGMVQGSLPAEQLAEIEELGLFTTIEKGIFADVKRPKDGGKGLSGVVVKDSVYFNPFIELMKGKVAAE